MSVPLVRFLGSEAHCVGGVCVYVCVRAYCVAAEYVASLQAHLSTLDDAVVVNNGVTNPQWSVDTASPVIRPYTVKNDTFVVRCFHAPAHPDVHVSPPVSPRSSKTQAVAPRTSSPCPSMLWPCTVARFALRNWQGPLPTAELSLPTPDLWSPCPTTAPGTPPGRGHSSPVRPVLCAWRIACGTVLMR